MKAAIVRAPGELVLGQVPMPQVGPWDALVRIEACSLCNATDTRIVDRRLLSDRPLPLLLGHESVGTVLEVGSHVETFKVGQRVLRPGQTVAPDGYTSAWGGLAEYGLVTDAQTWRRDHPDQADGDAMWPKQQVIPSHLDPAEATALITLKEALSAARYAGIGPTTWTAIVGTGPVARSLVFWTRYLQAPFVVVFGRQERWCHDFLDLGANNYYAGEKPCSEDEAKVAGESAFDRVLEAVGSIRAIQDALVLARPDGHVGSYGVMDDGIQEPVQMLKARESGRLITLRVREEHVHEEVLALVAAGIVRLDQWISQRLPFNEIDHALELVRSKQAVKVVLEM